VFNKLDNVKWIQLDVSYATAEERLRKRQDHIFPVSLLRDQFVSLQPLQAHLRIDASVDLKTVKNAVRSLVDGSAVD